MTSGVAIAAYVCMYLALGAAISVGTMKGRFTTYSSDDFEDTFVRGIGSLAITVLWPIIGTIITLGRLTK